jgi:diguanylate cyclase (GGDEF)-like protein
MAHTGARRGVLLLEIAGQWWAADSTAEAACPPQPVPLEDGKWPDMPLTLVDAVLQTRQDMVLSPLAADTRFAHDAYLLARQPAALLCLPLLQQETLLGLLYLERGPTDGSFAPEQQEAAELLAHQAALVIGQARHTQHLEGLLHEYRAALAQSRSTLAAEVAERKKAEQTAQAVLEINQAHVIEMKGIKQIAETLNQAIAPDDALQAGLQAAVRLMQARFGWLWLVSESGALHLAAAYQTPPDLGLQSDPTRQWVACDCLQRLLDGSLRKPAQLLPCQRLAQAAIDAHRQHVSLPIHLGMHPVGVLNLVIPRTQDSISAREMRLFSAIRTQFGVAIERARLFEQTREALLREQRLNEVTRAISDALDLQTVLQRVVSLAIELVNADAGGMGLISEDGQSLDFSYFINLPETLGRENRVLQRGEGLAWHTLEEGQARLVSDYPAHPWARPVLVAAGVHSVIAVPIIVGNQPIGSLGLFGLKPTTRFSPRDLALAESVGRQAGIAVQNARLFDEVRQMAITDALTGLHNRRYFFERASSEFERTMRYPHPLSAIMLDIDHFKHINDTYGHATGDEVLRVVARRCRDILRTVDIIGRYGGEEFAIVLPETRQHCARQVAERLRLEISQQPIPIEESTLSITASLGIAAYDHNESIDLYTLLDRADQALYAAKQAGRNCVVIWEPTPLPAR